MYHGQQAAQGTSPLKQRGSYLCISLVDLTALVQRREGRLGCGVIGLGHLLYVKQKELRQCTTPEYFGGFLRLYVDLKDNELSRRYHELCDPSRVEHVEHSTWSCTNDNE